MILLLGDIHGHPGILGRALEVSKESNAKAIIQLGDFCMFPDSEEHFRNSIRNAHIPIYFIDGNHDDCTRWVQYNSVHKVWDDRELYYIPRGTVMKLDGRTIAFMGGAASIDKQIRLENGMHWDHNENIADEHINRMEQNMKGKKIDMFLTHCPPNSVVERHFDAEGKLFFGVGLDWTDPAQKIIEDLWDKMGNPNIFSGHMHRRVQGKNYRILNINEVLAV
jgi:predicted phosphodiesterase